jgi:hypothetical protein
MLRTCPARFVKIVLNREIMLDFGLKFCYTIIVERARKEYRLPKSAHRKSTKLSTILLNLNVRTGKKTVTE